MRRLVSAFTLLFLMMVQPATAQYMPGAGAPPEATGLLNLLNSLSQIHSPADAAAAADAIATQLANLNVSGGINGLGSILPGDVATGAPDLASFGNILSSAQNGDLVNAMNNVYTELTNRYNVPGLDPDTKQEIYNQLSQLQGLMQNQNALNAGLTLAQSNVTNLLNNAGLGDIVNALGGLINGNGDPAAIAQALANTDLTKLNQALQQLGMPGIDSLAKFLPPGVDPAVLGQILDAFKNGGIDALLGTLENMLKDKLKNALPQDIPGLNDLIDQIGNLRNDPAGALTGLLNGLLNGSGQAGSGPTSDCKMNSVEQVMTGIVASHGDLSRSPGMRLCQ